MLKETGLNQVTFSFHVQSTSVTDEFECARTPESNQIESNQFGKTGNKVEAVD